MRRVGDRAVSVVQTRPRALLAAVAVLIAAAGYVGLWLGYRQGWGWLAALDSSSLTTLYDIGVNHPAWVQFWEVVSAVFSPTGYRILAALAIVVVLVQRNLRAALFLIVTVQLSGVVIATAKGLADRPRPGTALSAASSSSFPSGHALGAMVGTLALLVVLVPMLHSTARLVAIVAGAVVVVAVGFSRVALNVHHLSDVLAGWALGYVYVLLWARVLRVSVVRAPALRVPAPPPVSPAGSR